MKNDKIKQLLSEEQYEEVIKETEKSFDIESFKIRIVALMNLDRFDEVLKILEAQRDFFKKEDIIFLVQTHIFVLCYLHRYDDAYAESKIYQDMPYISQEVEELLNGLDDFIRTEERNFYQRKEIEDVGLEKSLKSEKPDTVFQAINVLHSKSKEEALQYLPQLKNIIADYPIKSIRTIALFFLFDLGVDEILLFADSSGKIIQIDGKNPPKPFGDGKYNLVLDLATELVDDFSAVSIIESLLANYDIESFPYILEYDTKTIFVAAYSMALDYLGRSDEYSLDNLCDEHDVDERDVRACIEELTVDLSFIPQ